MSDLFIIYIYCLINNDDIDKYLIKQKCFSPYEQKVYDVIYKMRERDEPTINRITVAYDMQVNDLSREFNLILAKGEKLVGQDYNIDVYYKQLLNTYILNKVDNAKTIAEKQAVFEEWQEIQEITSVTTFSPKDSIDMILNDEGVKALKTGLKAFDEDIFLASGILQISGQGGSGKTSLLVELIKRIVLYQHGKKKVSVLWNCMEDGRRMTMASMMSKDVGVPAKHIIRKLYNAKEREEIVKIKGIFDIVDIAFQDKQLYIDEIKTQWQGFLKKKKKAGCEYPILIIDNIMQLLDGASENGNQTGADDHICRQIGMCRNEAKKIFGEGNFLIIFLHHLSKEQLQKTNSKMLYIPNKSNIKGSSRYFDISTIVLLLHVLNKDFIDVRQDFEGLEDYLDHLMFINCIKNREGGFIGLLRIWFCLTYKYASNFENEPEE